MQLPFFEDITIENEDFGQKPFTRGEYEQCRFIQCNFSATDLSNCRFIDCIFEGCNLSNAKISQTAFRDVKFIQCKMLGLHFDTCQAYGVSFSFENCILNHSSFYGTAIKKTIFRNCQLLETDYTGADLSGALFDNCNLFRATFENTNLEKADFTTATDYTIDPTLNKIKKARFGVMGLAGLLTRYDIIIQ